jgi:hypothetical protein
MIRPIFALALCLMMLGPAVQAAELTRFQVVPQAGFRLGGKFVDAETDAGLDLADAGSFGVGLEWRVGNENRWWQLWYSRQGSEVKTQDGSVDVDVEYLHVGGTAPIDDEGKVHSYVAAGIGATRLLPTGAGLDDATKFSGSLGIGFSMPLSPRVAFRVEARGYLTLVDSDTSIFCRSDFGEGACRIVTSGSSLFQVEITAGIAFGF